MPDYKEMYFILFRATEKAIEQINKCDNLAAKEIIIAAQQQTEEMYIKD